jgi:hypothetical protein
MAFGPGPTGPATNPLAACKREWPIRAPLHHGGGGKKAPGALEQQQQQRML